MVVAATRINLYDNAQHIQNSQYYQAFLEQLPSPIAQITKMVVHPEHKGQGLANYLLEQSIARARGLGAACVTGTLLDYVKGFSFMAKHGLEELGETELPRYPKAKRQIVFAKKL